MASPSRHRLIATGDVVCQAIMFCSQLIEQTGNTVPVSIPYGSEPSLSGVPPGRSISGNPVSAPAASLAIHLGGPPPTSIATEPMAAPMLKVPSMVSGCQSSRSLTHLT